VSGGTTPDPDLLDQLRAGDRSAADELDRAYAALAASGAARSADEVLDAIAMAAAAGAPMAVNLLATLVHRHRLADRAVAQVLIDPADIDDAVQLALIAVVERVNGFQGRARFRTWLFRVARNEALMLLRRKQRRPEPVGGVPDGTGGAAAPGGEYVRRLSSVVAGRLSIEQMLAGLPEHYREPLRLRELEQLEYAEIADRLGLPIGTVRSRIARAREQLARTAWTW
jgi:RNA polymerase sigma-70 factor (ECF subfamily)